MHGGNKWCWAKVGMPIWYPTRYEYRFGETPENIVLYLPKAQVREFEYEHGGDSTKVKKGETVVSVHVTRQLADDRGMEVLE